MSEIIGNELNIQIARLLDVLRVTHLDDKVYYDGENYIEDLNAMHKAVNSLHLDNKIKWTKALRRLCLAEKTGQYPTYYDDYICHNATALQRAEAFVNAMSDNT